MYEPNTSETDIEVPIPAPTQKLITQTKDQMFSHNRKVQITSLEKMK